VRGRKGVKKGLWKTNHVLLANYIRGGSVPQRPSIHQTDGGWGGVIRVAQSEGKEESAFLTWGSGRPARVLLLPEST